MTEKRSDQHQVSILAGVRLMEVSIKRVDSLYFMSWWQNLFSYTPFWAAFLFLTISSSLWKAFLLLLLLLSLNIIYN